MIGPEFPWSAHARPRRAEKRSVRVGAAARILLKRFWPPTHDWDRAPGSFFARGHIWCKAVHFVEGRANTQLRTSADAYNRREVRPRFPGFGRPAYTHTSFGKSPSGGQTADAVHERFEIAGIAQNQQRSAHREASHRSGPPHTHTALTKLGEPSSRARVSSPPTAQWPPHPNKQEI